MRFTKTNKLINQKTKYKKTNRQMKKTNYALLVLLALVLASCSAYKQVPSIWTLPARIPPSMMPASCPRTC